MVNCMSDASKLAFIDSTRRGDFLKAKPKAGVAAVAELPVDELESYERRLIQLLIEKLERA
jgi:hypothetical protein